MDYWKASVKQQILVSPCKYSEIKFNMYVYVSKNVEGYRITKVVSFEDKNF